MPRARDPRVSVRLLGPCTLTVDGVPVALGPRLRALLAVLALDAGRPVPPERIVAAVWGEGRPGDSRKAVQVLVARLRAALGARAVRTTAAGYRLEVPPDAVDVLRFEAALARGRAAPDAAGEYGALRAALAHWGGPPFEAVPSDLLVTVERPRLVERALGAVERTADLALAAHPADLGELAATLREQVGLHPLRESLWVRLMAVLDRAGRRADALAAYQELHDTLRDELGTHPGAEARAAHRRLLADAATTGDADLPVPDGGLAGRDAELAALDALLAADPATRVAVVDGPGGIGKTTTVLHWARRVADRFPDGSLYVNLRGFSPAGSPLAPAAAVRRFLDALGVPAGRIPADADAQAALYRSVLADRRTLVVLDNARDVEQVRPLLPGGRHCVVVVTSRNRLGGLVAREGAARVTLGSLPPADARHVLAARLGAARLAAEPAATEELVRICGGLPLAHVVVAERAAGRPEASLAGLAGELRRSGSRIGALSAVFSWSYHALSPDAARAFRLLGLHPGPHVTLPAVASLGALTRQRARAAVAELERASLLTEQAPGRYATHELLLDYAVELVAADPPAERAAATTRMLDHYLRTAHQAEETLAPMEDPHTLGPLPDGVLGAPAPTDFGAGVGVLLGEAPVLVALVRRAAATGHHEHTWRLTRCLRPYLWGRGQVATALETERLALAALEALGRVPEQVTARCWIVHALLRTGQPGEARSTAEAALALAEDVADERVRAWAQHATGVVLAADGRLDEALRRAEDALALFRQAHDQVGEGRVAPAAGAYLRGLGRLDDALAVARHAFTLQGRTGDHRIQALTRELIGDIRHDRGEHLAAAEELRVCARELRAFGRTAELAAVLDKLGAAYDAAGDPAAAETARREARSVRDAPELVPVP